MLIRVTSKITAHSTLEEPKSTGTQDSKLIWLMLVQVTRITLTLWTEDLTLSSLSDVNRLKVRRIIRTLSTQMEPPLQGSRLPQVPLAKTAATR